MASGKKNDPDKNPNIYGTTANRERTQQDIENVKKGDIPWTPAGRAVAQQIRDEEVYQEGLSALGNWNSTSVPNLFPVNQTHHETFVDSPYSPRQPVIPRSASSQSDKITIAQALSCEDFTVTKSPVISSRCRPSNFVIYSI